MWGSRWACGEAGEEFGGSPWWGELRRRCAVLLLVVDQLGLDQVGEEFSAGGALADVHFQRRLAGEGIGGIDHVCGFFSYSSGKDGHAAKGRFNGAAGCAGFKSPEVLAFGRDDEADEAAGQSWHAGGSLSMAMGLVDVAEAALGMTRERVTTRCGAVHLQAAEEIDDDAGDRIGGGADIFGRVGAAIADDGGVGDHEGERKSARLFPSRYCWKIMS